MNLRELILRPGDRAWARGEVVARNGDFGLLLEPGLARETAAAMNTTVTIDFDRPGAVRLTGTPPPDGPVWEGWLGEYVAVDGLWTGSSLELDGTSHLHSVARPPRDVVLPPPFQPGDRLERLPVNAELEKARAFLRDSNALVSLHIPSSRLGDPHVYATATDVDLVRSTLEPIFGSRLAVIASRWDKATLRGLRDLIVDAPEEILRSFGSRNSPDHQELRTATVKYLSEDFARQLDPYPADALELTVLIRPVPVTSEYAS